MESQRPDNCDDESYWGSDEALRLDNQLCFALYVTSKEIIRSYKPLLDPLGLTYTAYIALLVLWEEDNITVKDLGGRLYLDSGTLTPLLKKMEKSGLIRRSRGIRDERTVCITLTDRGRSLKERARRIPRTLICASEHHPQGAAELLAMLRRFMPSGPG